MFGGGHQTVKNETEYTEEEYENELKRIEQRFLPFLQICRENHTAIRIGVNHGSLSDRIMSHYGDTPEGIVESCMEFLRICQREHFDDVVISIKASNTVVMVRSVRLLVDEMERSGMHYPLHLGVTEAGEGEDGRVKSALGIGALLSDGIGDTIRVSLSEEPEAEIPVARKLVNHIMRRNGHIYIPGRACSDFNYLHPQRRATQPVADIGCDNMPVVIATDMGGKAGNAGFLPDQHPDYIYVGSEMPQDADKQQKYLVDFHEYHGEPNTFPIFPSQAMPFVGTIEAPLKFVVLQFGCPVQEYAACLRMHPEVVVVAITQHLNPTGDLRALAHEMMNEGLTNPIVFCLPYQHNKDEKEDFQIEAAADTGALLIDGLADGLWLMNNGDLPLCDVTSTAFGILQAARLRMSKTEYISCPGCGRTLYDMRSTIEKIKEATKHLKGLKIGIMGCIVNGPGEMADADYGYVGAARGKISLYKGKTCIEKNIPEEEAVEKLLQLIQTNNKQI